MQRVPKWCKFTAEAEDKFPESIWKALYYTVTWVWALYLVGGGKVNIFFDLSSHWDGKKMLAVLLDYCSAVGLLSLLCSLESFCTIGARLVLVVHDSNGVLSSLHVCFNVLGNYPKGLLCANDTPCAHTRTASLLLHHQVS